MRSPLVLNSAHRAKRGKFAEDLLENTHTVYRLESRALMTHVPARVGRLHRRDENTGRGQFTGFYKKRTVADYLGVIAPGRPLAVELKSVEDKPFYLSRLGDHQSAFLDHWAALGGLAYLLVVFLGAESPPPAAVAKWPHFLREIATTGHHGRGFTWATFDHDITSAAAVPTDVSIAIDYLRAIHTVEARLQGAGAPRP